MKDSRVFILQSLSEKFFQTSKQLAQLCGLSEKTIRVRVKELKSEMESHGAILISKQGQGYSLHITDMEAFSQWKMQMENQYKSSIPDNPADREDYLLAMLLNREEFIRYEDIIDFLYVSQKTLSTEMKRVESRLKEFNIEVVRKPGYGIRIKGHEFDVRRCIMEYFNRIERRYSYSEEKQVSQKQETAKYLLEKIKEKKIRFSEDAFESVLSYINISIRRMETGKYIRENHIPSRDHDMAEQQLALDLMEWIAKSNNLDKTKEEILYLGIFLASKRMLGTDEKENNFIISEKIDKLVMSMLKMVYETFHIELRDNFNLRMLLNQHMMPMDIRMKYGILLENPLLKNIQQKYLLAYSMATQGCIALKEYYGKEVPDEEIGFLAVLFALALDEKEQMIEKKNILLVCTSGKASSQMLLYQLKKEFGAHLKEIYICNIYELDTFDLKDIDYIFTTVPISKHVPVPIVEIHDFLEFSDILSVRKRLEGGDRRFLLEFYKREFFFPHIKAETRDQVLKKMCERINLIYPLPEGFYESVLEREALGSTDYGNLVAIPHPSRVMLDQNIISVGILDRPIRWSKNDVQLVVLVAIANSTRSTIQKFYEITSKVLLSSKGVNRILKSKEYETLLQVLLETE
nr:BglG family transcription antiterminator [uncultured Clostridium sp.]